MLLETESTGAAHALEDRHIQVQHKSSCRQTRTGAAQSSCRHRNVYICTVSTLWCSPCVVQKHSEGVEQALVERHVQVQNHQGQYRLLSHVQAVQPAVERIRPGAAQTAVEQIRPGQHRLL
jgi:hypothetical protein